MYGKTIKYTDYNGEEKTKTFYFNFTRTELAKMNLYEKGGMKEVIKKMVNEDDNKKIIDLFESLVLGAYGEKGVDGESFLKSDDIRERFKCHPAYDELFIQLISGGEEAIADFINHVVPDEISENIKKVDKTEIENILNPQPN